MLENITLEAKLLQRSNFSVQHIMAAARFSRLCYQVEKEHMGEKLGSFYDEIISYTTAAVFSSVASLEANVNEIFADVLDNSLSIGTYDQTFLKEFWRVVEEKSIIEKYKLLYSMKNNDKLNTGGYVYHAVDTLIKSRNVLVHFKPEWQDRQVVHDRIGKQLLGKFQMSPFIIETAPVFPVRCMTHGFAEWAVVSTIDYVKWFADLLNIPYRYEKYVDKLNTK